MVTGSEGEEPALQVTGRKAPKDFVGMDGGTTQVAAL